MTATTPRGKGAAANDALSALRVVDRLEVGPVRVEPRRLVAPYTVVAGDRTETTDLIYRYGEDVFRPGEPASENLAAFMAAQVALNYGLFCDRIVLRGPLDGADRAFLRAMAANTAREIYVKKLCEANPFLVGAAASIEPVRLRTYLQARLDFPDARIADQGFGAGPWAVEPARHVVLSSGGKDSLLSYALLNECGREAHAVFVNESGRHWFTALNTFRHFEAHVPHTARVWTNADRLFSWMLRRLPFVRQDFARFRSDEYPIRLWTVAVFLVGALPLMRKRRAGRLVIGDEYDTSRRYRHEGIPHYDGLYDQSVFFDRTLSRFFGRKGWGIEQFSLLRPLSELLIEKILVERYPELQRHQVSCHAAHQEGGRVLPCGRCEKCRRIVAMLSALGADPRACGYDPERIDACLADLRKHGVHQEAECARTVASLLEGRGLVPAGSARVRRGDERVLGLRFHPEISPMDAIPRDLRRPLLAIYLEYATGAWRREGREWTAFDPLSHPETDRPNAFEARSRVVREDAGAMRGRPASAVAESADRPLHAVGLDEECASLGGRAAHLAEVRDDGPGARSIGGDPEADPIGNPCRGPGGCPPEASGDSWAGAASGDQEHRFGLLTWPRARARLTPETVALLPVGAIEQHGPHLPLDTDAFDAEYLALRVAEGCSVPRPVVLPLIPYGVSYHHEDFPGTLAVSPEALTKIVYDVGMSAARNGLTKLVIVNGHGGNAPALHFAAQMINRDARIFTAVDSGETSDPDVADLAATPNDVHAGEIETSTTMAVRPAVVDLVAAKACVPRFSSRFLNFSSRRSVEWYARTVRFSASGVLGDPTKADAAKGARIWAVMIRNLIEFVEDVKTLRLEEIYERRY